MNAGEELAVHVEFLSVLEVPSTRLRILLVISAFFLAFGFSRPANAQVGIYGEFSGAINASANRDPTGMYGATVGSYFNHGHFGPLTSGLDARGVLLTGADFGGSNYHINSFLVGPRVVVGLGTLRLKPYFEFLVGNAWSSSGSSYSGFTYEPLGGLDVKINSHIDWRAIELSYQGAPSNNNNLNNNTRYVKTGILSTGIVLHF